MAEDIIGPRTVAGQGSQFGGNAREYIRFGRDDVSVYWSDDVSSPEFEDGLFLADCLSGLAQTALEGAAEAKLAQDLSIEPRDLFYDATPDVVRPLARSAVERWKKRTGLPEPFE